MPGIKTFIIDSLALNCSDSFTFHEYSYHMDRLSMLCTCQGLWGFNAITSVPREFYHLSLPFLETKDFFETYLQLPHTSTDGHLVFYVPTAFCPFPDCTEGHLQASKLIRLTRLASLLGRWPFSIDFESSVLVTSLHRGNDQTMQNMRHEFCIPNSFISKYFSIKNPCEHYKKKYVKSRGCIWHWWSFPLHLSRVKKELSFYKASSPVWKICPPTRPTEEAGYS